MNRRQRQRQNEKRGGMEAFLVTSRRENQRSVDKSFSVVHRWREIQSRMESRSVNLGFGRGHWGEINKEECALFDTTKKHLIMVDTSGHQDDESNRSGSASEAGFAIRVRLHVHLRKKCEEISPCPSRGLQHERINSRSVSKVEERLVNRPVGFQRQTSNIGSCWWTRRTIERCNRANSESLRFQTDEKHFCKHVDWKSTRKKDVSSVQCFHRSEHPGECVLVPISFGENVSIVMVNRCPMISPLTKWSSLGSNWLGYWFSDHRKTGLKTRLLSIKASTVQHCVCSQIGAKEGETEDHVERTFIQCDSSHWSWRHLIWTFLVHLFLEL